MDSRRADVGESHQANLLSGSCGYCTRALRPMQRLGLQTPVMLSGNNAKHLGRSSVLGNRTRGKPPRDSDSVNVALDEWIASADQALRTLTGGAHASRPLPAAGETDLTPQERQLSGALLRVDHVGEVCAQALYQAQGLAARSPQLRQQMKRAAAEEVDHLACTSAASRNGRAHQLLNPLWYAGAFGIGLLAVGRATAGAWASWSKPAPGGATSRRPPRRLPSADAPSRAIVEQMKVDEAQHAAAAQLNGAAPLPAPIKLAMRLAARVMTQTAHYV
jgi:ubiquinone biosynthesis monooxygenase Coq7